MTKPWIRHLEGMIVSFSPEPGVTEVQKQSPGLGG
jgi:hypothetical protein